MKEALALAAAYSRLRFNGTVGDLSLSIAPRLKLRRSERTRIAHLLNRIIDADPVVPATTAHPPPKCTSASSRRFTPATTRH